MESYDGVRRLTSCYEYFVLTMLYIGTGKPFRWQVSRFKLLQAGYGKSTRTLVSNTAHLWDRRGRMPSMKSLISSLGLGIFYDQNYAHSKESKQKIYQNSNVSAYVMVRLYLAWTWNILRPEHGLGIFYDQNSAHSKESI